MSTVRSAVSRLDRQPKVVLKISPDCSAADRKAIAAICLDRKKFAIDALIVANTTIQRPETLRDESRSEIGGLSGRPLHRIAVECIADMYRLTNGRVSLYCIYRNAPSS
jgi:dihydroorotate dehydrogenase